MIQFKKIFVTLAFFFAILGLSSSAFAEPAKKKAPDVLKVVDAKIQEALNAIPSGNAEEVTKLIRSASEEASELSANYKFEFERDKAMSKLKTASKLSKSSSFVEAEKELKDAQKAFVDLKNFL